MKPGQVVAAVDPGLVELDVYMQLLWKAHSYRNEHPDLQRILSDQEWLAVDLITEDKGILGSGLCLIPSVSYAWRMSRMFLAATFSCPVNLLIKSSTDTFVFRSVSILHSSSHPHRQPSRIHGDIQQSVGYRWCRRSSCRPCCHHAYGERFQP